MDDMIHTGMERSLKVAEAVTQRQIEMALRLNAQHFDGEGLRNFPAILQAVAQNYNGNRADTKS